MSEKTGEVEPLPALEESVLTALGYGHCLDTEIKLPDGTTVRGRNFLDAYGNSPHRQNTEDMLQGFIAMDPDDPLYLATSEYIARFLTPHFGKPTNIA